MLDLSSVTPDQLRAMDKEEIIKALLDGFPHHTPTKETKDEYGNNLRRSYDVMNAYDGGLMDRIVVTWTYWDAPLHAVKDMTTEEGIRTIRRTIVHHREDGSCSEVEQFTVEVAEPAPEVAEVVVGRIEVAPREVPEPTGWDEPPEEVTAEPVPTRWEAFKKRAERAFFLLPKES